MSKENNIEQFDSFFKKALENASVEAPSGVWESVSSQIGAGAGAGVSTTVIGKAIFVKTVAILAVVAVSVVAIVNLVQEEPEPKTNKENVVLNEEQVDTAEETIILENRNPLSTEEKSEIKKKKILAVANKKEPIAKESRATDLKNVPKTIIIESKSPKKVEVGIIVPMVPKDAKSDNELNALNTKKEINAQVKEFYCKGEEINIVATGAKNAQWFIDNVKVGEGENLHHIFTKSGSLKLTLMTGSNTLFNTFLTVKGVNPSFKSKEIKEGEFVLTPVEQGASYIWNFNNSQGYQPSSESSFILKDYLRTSITVALIVKTEEGCIDSMRQNVANKFATKGNNPYITNAFTPGSNGFNDKFIIDIKYETYYNLVIKNLKGEEVFTSQDKNIHWDGKSNYAKCPVGLYTYTLLYKIKGSDELQIKNGTITLLAE